MQQKRRLPSSFIPALLSSFFAGCGPVLAQSSDPTALNLESLLNSTISSASKYEQEQARVPAAVSVITRDDIRAFGWRTLIEALNSLPGIHSTYDRQYHYLGVRGLGLPGDFNTRVLLAINGNRVNDVVYDGAQVGREFPLDMAMVERIEYIMGPGGAVYGQNAMIAVVNVITRNGFQLDGAEVQVIGVEPSAQREVSMRWGRRLGDGTDLLLSASAMQARGEDLVMEFPGLGPGNSTLTGIAAGLDGEDDRELFAQIKKNGFGVDLMYGRRRKEDPTAGYFSDPFVSGQNMRDSYLLGQLSYQQSWFADSLDALGRVFAGRQRFTQNLRYSGDRYVSYGASDWHGGELRLLYRAVPNHTLMLGLEAQDNIRADQRNDDFGPNGDDVDVQSTGYRAGVYLQDEWQLHERWVATLGARADRNNITGTKVSPRAALLWQTTPATNVKALFGRAWRAPNAYESLYQDGSSLVSNPGLAGERNDTYELIVEHSLGSELRVRASRFHWEGSDIIQLGTSALTGLPQYQNTGRIDATGVELALNGAWADGSRLWASLTSQDLIDGAGSPLVNSPQWLAKLAYSRPLPWAGLRLSLEMQYEDRRQTMAGQELDGSRQAHLSLSGDAGINGLEWSLSVRNLLDQRFYLPAAETNWQDALQQDGRQLRLQLSYRL